MKVKEFVQTRIDELTQTIKKPILPKVVVNSSCSERDAKRYKVTIDEESYLFETGEVLNVNLNIMQTLNGEF